METELSDGDQVQVGGSLFVFSFPDEGPSAQTPTADTGDDLLANQTVVLRPSDSIYLRTPQDGKKSLPATARTVRDLNALVGLSRIVTSTRTLEQIKDEALLAMVEVIPAERAAILLTRVDSDELSQRSWDKRFGVGADFPVSRTIVGRVLEDGNAILSNDIPGEAGLQDAKSLVLSKTRRVLAVPMGAFGNRLGVVYLDSAADGAVFDEKHLQLLTAFGNVLALGIENAKHFAWLAGENQRLNEEINVEHNMVGDSPRVREVVQFISRVAGRDSTVLIWGESGTGKELIARAIHRNSPRIQKPFIAINCAALTETLLESELFGHEKGAFTGAIVQKRGKLEAADGGTLFLDEVGEMPPLLQAKLLRVLQEREFERVGGNKTIKVDIRLIAATNRDLKEMSKTGAFRQDLYYRLNVVAIHTPALRERREDIPALASHFIAKYSERVKRKVSGISPKAHKLLSRYDWPGNVRELENAIERAVVLGVTEVILPEDLPELMIEVHDLDASDDGDLFESAVRTAKVQIIEKTLDQTQGNQNEAAKLLGMHPVHLSRLMKSFNVKPKRR